eukprot:CAMPEP_0172389500 /NCGR_PEP_ID=MMETSP1061-20121228/6385_1 /TAXON_ID=37318 /ORGANISM="Pseudo-nitzschia pungens, Strain cf. pungens" /LENGTH=60 /DNA_ID=CAMNT_0013119675 /DNA_START=183 /DNA_END=362 /DNA_ORIENTATION=-
MPFHTMHNVLLLRSKNAQCAVPSFQAPEPKTHAPGESSSVGPAFPGSTSTGMIRGSLETM